MIFISSSSSILILLLVVVSSVAIIINNNKNFVSAQFRFCDSSSSELYPLFYCQSRGLCLPITDEGMCACASSRQSCSSQIDLRGVSCRWNNSFNVPPLPLKGAFCGSNGESKSGSGNDNCVMTAAAFTYRCVPGLNSTQKQYNLINGIPNDEDISNDRQSHPCQPYDVTFPSLVAQPYVFLLLSVFKDLLVLVFLGIIGNWLEKATFIFSQTISDLWNFSWDSQRFGGGGSSSSNNKKKKKEKDSDNDDTHDHEQKDEDSDNKSNSNSNDTNKEDKPDEQVFYIHDAPFSTLPIRNPRNKNRRVWSFDDYCSAVAKQLFAKRSSKAAQRDLCDAIAFVLVNDFQYIELSEERPLSGQLYIPPYVPWKNLIKVVTDVLEKSSSKRVRYGLSASTLVRINVALNSFPSPAQLFLYVASAFLMITTTLLSSAVSKSSSEGAASQVSTATPRSQFQYFFFLVGYRIVNSSLLSTAVLVLLKTIRAILFTNPDEMVANRLSLLILKSSRPVFLLVVLYILLVTPFLSAGVVGGFFFGYPGPVVVLSTLPILIVLYFVGRCFSNYTASIEMRNLQQLQRRREYSVLEHSDVAVRESAITHTQNTIYGTNNKNTNKDDNEDNNSSSSRELVSSSNFISSDPNIINSNNDENHKPSWADLGRGAAADFNDDEESGISKNYQEDYDDEDDEKDDDNLAAFAVDRPETRSSAAFSSSSSSKLNKDKNRTMYGSAGGEFENNNNNNNNKTDNDGTSFSQQQQQEDDSSSTMKASSIPLIERDPNSTSSSSHHCRNASSGGKNGSSSSCLSSWTWANAKFFLRSLVRFLITEEILVILFSVVFSSSFNYTALLAKREEFGIEHIDQVFALEYNSRKINCVIEILNEKILGFSEDLPGFLQHTSFAVPFL